METRTVLEPTSCHQLLPLSRGPVRRREKKTKVCAKRNGRKTRGLVSVWGARAVRSLGFARKKRQGQLFVVLIDNILIGQTKIAN